MIAFGSESIKGTEISMLKVDWGPSPLLIAFGSEAAGEYRCLKLTRGLPLSVDCIR